MVNRIVAALIAMSALCACAGPAPRQTVDLGGMGWTYYETSSEGAKLVFGRPGSDDVPLMMTCPLKTGRVTVWVDSAPDSRARAFDLVSDQATSRVAAEMDSDELVLLGRTTVADPALRAFAASGRLTVRTGAERRAFPTAPSEPVRTFMKNCSG
jgi:hypothetical protein